MTSVLTSVCDVRAAPSVTGSPLESITCDPPLTGRTSWSNLISTDFGGLRATAPTAGDVESRVAWAHAAAGNAIPASPRLTSSDEDDEPLAAASPTWITAVSFQVLVEPSANVWTATIRRSPTESGTDPENWNRPTCSDGTLPPCHDR